MSRAVCSNIYFVFFLCIVDSNQIMELEEHEDHIQSGSVTQGIFVSNPPTDIPTIHKNVGDVKTSESSEKEELHVNGEDLVFNDVHIQRLTLRRDYEDFFHFHITL